VLSLSPIISALTLTTAFGLLNPKNDTAQISHIDPADSANISTVFSIAMHRIYPVFILEEHITGNLTSSTGNIGCVQALNLTNVEAGGVNSGSSTTSTSIVTGTVSSTEAGTPTGTKSQMGSTSTSIVTGTVSSTEAGTPTGTKSQMGSTSTSIVTGTVSTGAGTPTGTKSQMGSTTPTGSSSAAKGVVSNGLILNCAVVLGISVLF
jgi:hypothetical protein